MQRGANESFTTTSSGETAADELSWRAACTPPPHPVITGEAIAACLREVITRLLLCSDPLLGQTGKRPQSGNVERTRVARHLSLTGYQPMVLLPAGGKARRFHLCMNWCNRQPVRGNLAK